MAEISTLSKDIATVLKNADTVEVPDEKIVALAVRMAEQVRSVFGRGKRSPREPNKLYVSELGTRCTRQLWYKLHFAGVAEDVSPSAKVKFLYGNLLEELVLFLADLSGHEVKDQQKPVKWVFDAAATKSGKEITITGRRDATIDGCVVDVKSASPYSYQKIVHDGLTVDNDDFGYREQVSGYVSTKEELENPIGILAIDKQNGSIGFRETEFISPATALPRIEEALDSTTAPERGYEEQPQGESGNMKLCMTCSYCAYKSDCWSNANHGKGLRTFVYGGKPVFLTKVVREPRVPEVTRA